MSKSQKIHDNIKIITLGCSKNLVDSEFLAAQLRENKLKTHFEDEQNDASIVIINTCGFINDAKQESIDTILEYVEAKKQGKIQKIIVTGCLSERYKNELSKEISEVDYFCGVNDLDNILSYLNKTFRPDAANKRVISTPSHYAYLKISEGCDRTCSFCAIPLIRGKHISKTIDQVISEANNLVGQGVKELILIAQDLTYYGLDLNGKRQLPALLENLIKIDKLDWIRLHYAYPVGFPIEVIDIIKNSSKICKYIDIPIQHISDRILKSMKRNHTQKDVRDLLNLFRKMIPEIAIRTSVIVGYPGETKKEYNELINFIEEFKFDRLGVFVYSDEENTAAYELKAKIAEKEKQSRMEEIMWVQQKIISNKNSYFIGKTLNVLMDRVEGDYFIGRTEYDSPEIDHEVLIPISGNNVKIGNFYSVLIEDCENFDLFGRLA